MKRVNYSEFRANLKHWFDKVINDVSDIIIKRKNGKDLVLISLDEYNSFLPHESHKRLQDHWYNTVLGFPNSKS